MEKDYINKIRSKCIEANPEIVELKFGCYLKEKQRGGITTYIGRRKHDGTVEVINWTCWETKREIKSKYEIIGRPITLSDVLLAIKTQRVRLQSNISDKIFFEIYEQDDVVKHTQSWKATGIYWNLKETLENQSEETLKFISNLLTNK